MKKKPVNIPSWQAIPAFEQVADFSYDWVSLYDKKGDFIYISPSCERISGYRPEEFYQNQSLLLEITYPDDQAKVDKHLELEFEKKEHSQKIYFRIVSKAGEIRHIEHICSPVRFDDGKYSGQLAINRDITEARELEQALREANSADSNPHAEAGFIGPVIANSSFELATFEKESLHITFINKGFIEALGYREEDLLRMKITDILPEFDEESFRILLDQPVDHNRQLNIETFHKDITGNRYPVSVMLEKTRVNHIHSYLYTAVDISTRVDVQNALKRSERLLDLFFTQSLDGFFFMMLDEPIEWNEKTDKDLALNYIFKHQRITRVNKAMLDQYGITEKDFMGLTPNDFFKHDIDFGKEVWRKLFDDGKLHIETDERRANGEQMWVEGDYICIYEDDGKIAGHFGIQRDVTDKKIALMQLEESQKQLEQAQRIGEIGSWQADLVTKKNTWSKQAYELFGYKPGDLNPAEILENHLHPEDKPAYYNHIHREKQIPGEHLRVLDFRIITRNGRERYMRSVAEIEWNNENNAVKAYGTMQDVTEAKKSARTLEEANQTKDKFFSIIAHDLRNPFMAIMGYLDLLEDSFDFGKDDESALYFAKLQNSVNNTYKLLDNLLLWSRSESGRLEFLPESLDLNELIEQAKNDISSQAERKAIEIHFMHPHRPTPIYADKNMLQTVFRNLISNAVKFSNTGGQLKIEISKKATTIIVEVIDDGIGMNEQQINNLFKIDSSESREGTAQEKGTGLGLILAHEFIQKHGGSITVKSDPGRGSTFTVILPA